MNGNKATPRAQGVSLIETWAALSSAKGKNSSAGATSLIFIVVWTFFLPKKLRFYKTNCIVGLVLHPSLNYDEILL